MFQASVKKVVFFDTNAYRRLAYRAGPEEAVQRADALVVQERAIGVQALASPVVLLELLAHLHSEQDPSFDECRSAICAAVRHCRMPVGDGTYHIAICPSTDAQLCAALWQITPDEISANDDFVRAVAWRVSEDPSLEALAGLRSDLKMIAERFAETEKAFAEGTRLYLAPRLLESAEAMGFPGRKKELVEGFLAYLDTPAAAQGVAQAHVLRAGDHLRVTETPEGIIERAKFLAEHFDIGIQLYLHMVRKIVKSHWDLTRGKGANLLWDMQVAFLVGKNHTYQGRTARVVTGDAAIVEAARAVGGTHTVLGYEDYRSAVSDAGL